MKPTQQDFSPEAERPGQAKLTRRSMLKTSALAFPLIATRNVLGANERLNIAGVGVGGKGWTDITSVDGENVVGLCDVDSQRLGKAKERFPKAQAFADWREMYDKLGKEIDAVTVSTPDHMHFLPAYRAVREGKHVYCQKPLTQTLWEARTLAAAAREAKVATQMGNQGISRPKLRHEAALIKGGAIGEVKEVHLWTDRPGKWWKQGLRAPTEFPAAPPELNWDLWIGCSHPRPYHPSYGHFVWRGWWDYGTCAIGDMGCHLLNLATLAMNVRDPASVSARGEGATADTGPVWSEIEWQFPARDGKPGWKLFWYDGGHVAPQGLFPAKPFVDNGVVIIGEKDTFHLPGYGGGGLFKSGATHEDFKSIAEPPPANQPPAQSDRTHYDAWIAACKGGPKPLSNFDVAGPVTEVALLGQLALRVGQPLDWNAAESRVTNVPDANRFVKKEYRKGWEI